MTLLPKTKVIQNFKFWVFEKLLTMLVQFGNVATRDVYEARTAPTSFPLRSDESKNCSGSSHCQCYSSCSNCSGSRTESMNLQNWTGLRTQHLDAYNVILKASDMVHSFFCLSTYSSALRGGAVARAVAGTPWLAS